MHRPGQPPTYAFPDGRRATICRRRPEPAAPGYVRVPWDAVTAWYEEEEEVFGGHPRNPYHRIDCVRARRRLRVEVALDAARRHDRRDRPVRDVPGASALRAARGRSHGSARRRVRRSPTARTRARRRTGRPSSMARLCRTWRGRTTIRYPSPPRSPACSASTPNARRWFRTF